MLDTSPTNKRNTPESSKSAQKKAKSHSAPITIQRDHTLLEFWYGFPVMESLAYDASLPPITTRTPIAELIKLGTMPTKPKNSTQPKCHFQGYYKNYGQITDLTTSQGNMST